MRLGLGAKFTLAVLTILACTMAANTFYFLETSTRFHERQLVERGRALGRLISLVSPDAILGFDFLLLNDYTREVSSQPDVVYGVIVSPQGVPISSYINDADPLIKTRLEATDRTTYQAAAKTGRRSRTHPVGISNHAQQRPPGAVPGRYQPRSAGKRIPPAIVNSDTGADRPRLVSERGDSLGVPLQRSVSDPQTDRRI